MTTLTQKSQVTIPKGVREMLGLKPGDEVEFDIEDGGALIRKRPKKLPIGKWKGYVGNLSTETAMKDMR
ncbi:AbrB/MazE/SpoVT family DNA-binding domain-containing protein [Candidatus Woesearchaeota archaeon]|nr:AbrB/MazE/SpoVT family DNA-binding domain-containing protein [Candidatus Woesearchaeota archaeon]